MTKPLILSSEWIERLKQYDQLIVGFSGGLDSTALVHALALQPQLKSLLTAVHVNHNLSPNALNWQQHCVEWCAKFDLPCITSAVDFNRLSNKEAGAREARFAVFSSLLSPSSCLLLAHHLDDQAETILLHLLRGTGIDGLAGMASVGVFSLGHIARPLLSYTRKQLHDYALEHNLQWVDDESNEDQSYSRNYIRHQIIPLLEKKWPQAVKNLARSAAHCLEAQSNLQALALADCNAISKGQNSLPLQALKTLPEARVMNVLRAWLKSNKIQMPTTMILQRIMMELIWGRSDSTAIVEWNDMAIRSYREQLYLIRQKELDPLKSKPWFDFPNSLELTSDFFVHAKQATKGIDIPQNAVIEIKFRQGGERIIVRGQTKNLKKLWQEWGVPTWVREQTPLLYIDGQLASVIGYAISDTFYVEDGVAWVIEKSCS